MMNFVALSLVLISLAAAGLFSPIPESHQKNQKGPNTIIREGHRAVVVEYDEDGHHHNTKISISPQQNHHKFTDVESSTVLDNTREKIREAASVLPDIGQGLSQGPHHSSSFLHAPGELICDAYGKCKHKISGAMGRARDKLSETAHEAVDKQKEMARDIIDAKKEIAREVGDSAADAVGKAKEAVSHKAHDAKESTKEYVEKAKDVGETVGKHIVRNVSEEAEDLKEAAKSAIGYLGSEKTLSSLMGVVHLLGFATAYGLCVWITFVSSYVLSRAIPRQQFGIVQSKIYPVYFRVLAYCIGMALVGHVLGQRKRVFSSKAEMWQVYNLVHCLLTVLVNSIYLEPRATKLMFERMKIEKEEGRGREDISTELPSRAEEHQQRAGRTGSATTATRTTTAAEAAGRRAEDNAVRCRVTRLNEKLRRLNAVSSFLNIMTLMSLTWHMVYLAQCLHHSHCIE